MGPQSQGIILPIHSNNIVVIVVVRLPPPLAKHTVSTRPEYRARQFHCRDRSIRADVSGRTAHSMARGSGARLDDECQAVSRSVSEFWALTTEWAVMFECMAYRAFSRSEQFHGLHVPKTQLHGLV